VTTLYHYTCGHGFAGLGRGGVLRPNPQPFLGGARLVWFTDMVAPDVYGLGLTSETLSCERTEYRYVIADPLEASAVTPWRIWQAAHRIRPDVVARLEFERMPGRWWVADHAVPVVLDESWST
jgi:hypothetical protein